MIGHKSVAQGIVLKRPSPTEEDPRCKVCGQALPNGRPVREGQEKQSVSFEEWLQSTLWSVAAP